MRSSPAVRDLKKVLTELSYSHMPLRAFEAFVALAACACSAGAREDEYMREIQGWSSVEQKRFPEAFALLVDAMEAEPLRDVLGLVYMELGSQSTQKWNGEFYTPPEICELMARMVIGDAEIPHDRPLTFLEPACGAGAQVLACARQLVHQGFSPLNMRATCIDVSKLACDMCFVNLSLSGIPAEVIHGNSLSLETWGGWRTIMWPVAHGARRSPAEPPRAEAMATVEQVEALTAARGQLKLELWEEAS